MILCFIHCWFTPHVLLSIWRPLYESRLSSGSCQFVKHNREKVYFSLYFSFSICPCSFLRGKKTHWVVFYFNDIREYFIDRKCNVMFRFCSARIMINNFLRFWYFSIPRFYFLRQMIGLFCRNSFIGVFLYTIDYYKTSTQSLHHSFYLYNKRDTSIKSNVHVQ